MRASHFLRFFPRGWRERYGDEFLATVGDEPLRLRQVIDIAACAADAWTSGEVRSATRPGRADPHSGERIMWRNLMTSCGSTEIVWTRRDAILGAFSLIGATILFCAAGIAAKRTGLEAAGETLLAIAFPGSLLLAMPFTYLKGRSWRVQLVLVGVPLAILVAIAFLAQLL